MDEEGHLKIPLRYQSAKEFDDYGFALVGETRASDGNLNWGLTDKENNLLLPPIFEAVDRVSANYYRVRVENNAFENLINASTMELVGKDFAWATRRYASYYFDRKDFVKSVLYHQRLVDSGKAKPDDIFNLAVSYSRSEQYDKALKYVEQILTLPNKDMTDKFKSIKGEKACVLWKQGKLEEARKLYDETFAETNERDLFKKYSGSQGDDLVKIYSDMRLEFAELLAEMNLG